MAQRAQGVFGSTSLTAQPACQACRLNGLPDSGVWRLNRQDGLTIVGMPIRVPSCQANKANDDDSVSVDDLTPVTGSRPQKVHNGPGCAPICGPWTMIQSLVWTSRATTPPSKHVLRPEEAFAVKEPADGHFTRPQARARSPVQTAKRRPRASMLRTQGRRWPSRKWSTTMTTSAMAWPHSVNNCSAGNHCLPLC